MRKDKGFTLIEVVTALALLALMVIPLATLLTQSYFHYHRAGRRTQEAARAAAFLEELAALGYSQVKAGFLCRERAPTEEYPYISGRKNYGQGPIGEAGEVMGGCGACEGGEAGVGGGAGQAGEDGVGGMAGKDGEILENNEAGEAGEGWGDCEAPAVTFRLHLLMEPFLLDGEPLHLEVLLAEVWDSRENLLLATYLTWWQK